MINVDKEWVILETKGFQTITDCLDRAYSNSFFMALIGNTGFGKSLTFEKFKTRYPNIHVIPLSKTWGPKNLYLEIHHCLQIYNYTLKDSVKDLSDKAIQVMAKRKDKSLFIFDEAGKFDANMLEHFQPMRDASESNTAFILSGTNQFRTQFDNWVAKNKLGIPELDSRIYSWIDVPEPTFNEKSQILRANGVSTPSIVKDIASKSKDLRKLYQNTMLYKTESSALSSENI